MKKLLILFFAIIPLSLNAYTRGDVITEIRNELSDTNTDPSIRIFSDTLLHSRIDQAEDDINKQTRCMVSRSTISTTCGTGEYQFPDNVMAVNRVMYDTDGSSLTVKYTELAYNLYQAGTMGNFSGIAKQASKDVTYVLPGMAKAPYAIAQRIAQPYIWPSKQNKKKEEDTYYSNTPSYILQK
jgi:hypothetical protein